MVRQAALANGAFAAVVSTHWSDGGAGAEALATALIEACNTSPPDFRFLYELDLTIDQKILTIAREMYGAGAIELSPKAREAMRLYTAKGFDKLPICMSKTANSLTGDASIKGAPVGFTLTVNDLFLSAGAGFIVAMCGEISKMPGLPTRPCIYDIDLNTETGEIEGLF